MTSVDLTGVIQKSAGGDGDDELLFPDVDDHILVPPGIKQLSFLTRPVFILYSQQTNKQTNKQRLFYLTNRGHLVDKGRPCFYFVRVSGSSIYTIKT